MIYVDGKAVHAGQQPAWRPPKRVRELLPDFDQRAPTDLTIAGGPGRWLLGFTSLVDNIGIGPSMLVGVRPPGQTRMIGTQRVRLANGKRAHLRRTSRGSATRTRRRTITGT